MTWPPPLMSRSGTMLSFTRTRWQLVSPNGLASAPCTSLTCSGLRNASGPLGATKASPPQRWTSW
eukprot:12427899-Alexandrium_andersonii.AAC.1